MFGEEICSYNTLVINNNVLLLIINIQNFMSLGDLLKSAVSAGSCNTHRLTQNTTFVPILD